MSNEKNDVLSNNLILPEDLQEIHSIGAAIGSTPFNIRLLFYNDELDKEDIIHGSSSVKLVRKAKAEIILPPSVAEQVANLLLEEAKKFKK
jgi:hypothetical protein